MVKILRTAEDLKVVLQDLPAFYPKSHPMEVLINNAIAKTCEWPGMEFIVDDYPQWNVCLYRPIKNSEDYVNRQTKYGVSIFCKNTESLENFLDNPDAIDWDMPVNFHAIPRTEIFDIIRRKCLSVNPDLLWDGNEHCHVFLLSPDQIKTTTLPPGLHLGELRESHHADYVLDRWDFTEPETRPYVHYLLATASDFPNAAIFDMDTGLPCAFLLYTCDGAMGMGWVSPNYRNKGLFQIVNYELARKLFALGHKVAWTYVREDNEAAVRAYQKMGAKKCDFQIDWLVSRPRGDTGEHKAFDRHRKVENSTGDLVNTTL
ncbi:uncharacterized protein LOC129595853 [Paramacrobiotus metropolitanus]|uniref:uncharacterized protein LOC129595853 n=1 Tax=Paramacrobiotus metropolitanus TaxID=2943436 RepID=UPI0024459DA0|nr:uncharacterized protein LOC129595853 [Paramacrobiotus metropolitanus]